MLKTPKNWSNLIVLGVKPYSHIYLVRMIPNNQDIPQVLLLVVGFGDKNPKESGYFASFTSIFTRITNLTQDFPNIQEILPILHQNHSKPSSFITAKSPKNWDQPIFIKILYAQYLLTNFMWFYVDI